MWLVYLAMYVIELFSNSITLKYDDALAQEIANIIIILRLLTALYFIRAVSISY